MVPNHATAKIGGAALKKFQNKISGYQFTQKRHPLGQLFGGNLKLQTHCTLAARPIFPLIHKN